LKAERVANKAFVSLDEALPVMKEKEIGRLPSLTRKEPWSAF
jgi:hypothetical protein